MSLTSPIRHRRWLLVSGSALVLLMSGIAYLYFHPAFIEARLRRGLTQALTQRFQSEVDLQDLQVKLLPRLKVTGHNLSLHYHGRRDVPPLIYLSSFSVSAGWFAFLRPVAHIPLLRLEDLQITIPPHDHTTEKPHAPNHDLPRQLSNIVIDRVVCEHADIRILPRQSGKVPLDWDIHQLTLLSASATQPFQFKGYLTNGKPIGDIATHGQFGPWNADDPGETPVSGEYQFTNADLTPLPGIGGVLSSTGRYAGALAQLEVDGTTDTPDFSLDAVGTPVPLHTEFSATVDGTNGDTQLHPVSAVLVRSLIIAEGSVERVPGASGHLISIEATVPNGRIQDFLELATRSEKPILTGPVKIKAKLVIPPGKEHALDKISLDGHFGVEDGSWSNPAMREKIESLSRHALGKPEQEDAGSAITDIRGDFTIRKGVLHFSRLTFHVEGAAVDLAGTYAMRQGTLDLTGHLTLQAKLSQTVTGTKSLLLKVFDPFFEKKGAGAVLPIHISGTREKPVFGVSVFHKSFEKSLKASSNNSQ
ncbi:MAG TPA: AsmA-like C-terminal region-containing protein [Candidatus Eisenbacteria bacterium]|nr:AsmA-like C-terminal region-containing protein [Candidatus Eisenbacteria bacterium]